MATTANKYQLIQKIAADEYLLLHPETDAEVVLFAAEGITADNVQDAIIELKGLISDITGGGVVTGVKGSSETSYRQGNVNITKENIGLGNVDNTSDANKPISIAQQAALDEKEYKSNLKALAYKDSLGKADVGLGNVTNDAQVKRSEMGNANGVATLDSTGKVPSSQLPSYVDDVLEFTNKAAFPEAGEEGKIYVDKSTNKTYRWSGSAYVEISASLALGETSSTAYAGDKGKANAEAISALQTRATDIETKNTEQDTAIATAQSDATSAKTTAEAAMPKAGGTFTGMVTLSGAPTENLHASTKKYVDDTVAPVKTTADGAKSAAATAQAAAEAAQEDATANAAEISNIKDGTTEVGKAGEAGKLSTARTIELKGDATGSASFDGSANKDITVTLANSGVTAGSYSAVTVDAKGRVTQGAQFVEVGTAGQVSPSATLAVGGLFFKRM